MFLTLVPQTMLAAGNYLVLLNAPSGLHQGLQNTSLAHGSCRMHCGSSWGTLLA